MEEIPAGKIKFVDCIIMPNNKKPSSKRSYQLKKEVLEKAVISERDFSADLTGSRQEQNFGLNLFFKNLWEKVFNAFGEFKLTVGYVFKLLLASKIGLILVLITLVVPLTAFEAHIVNVTATIERRQNECPALSIGYWRNHEGCTGGGNGSSVWEPQVQTLSASSFSGVFGSYSGAQICGNLWIPNCPSGNNVNSKFCKAKAHVLGNELNVVSGRQDLAAILAGADDGDAAFDNLGLDSNSTVSQALATAEQILINGTSSTATQLENVIHVASRIYNFYESENPEAPMCLYSWPLPGFSAFSASSAPIDGEGEREPVDSENMDDSVISETGSLGASIIDVVQPLISGDESSTSTDATTSTTASVGDTNGAATTTTDGISTDSTSTIPEATSTEPVVDSAPTPTEPTLPPADTTSTTPPPSDTTPPADTTPPPADSTPPPADPTPPPTDPTPPPVSDPPPAS